jgi:hypothetical protein
VKLSPREARERDALGARELAGDRLDLGHFLRGENGAGGPTALYLRGPRAALRRSVFASARPPPSKSQAVRRSRCWSRRPRPSTRAWPAGPRGGGGCSRRRGARARPAPRRSG